MIEYRLRPIEDAEIEQVRKTLDKPDTHGETVCSIIKSIYKRAKNIRHKDEVIQERALRALVLVRRMDRALREYAHGTKSKQDDL